VELAEKLIDGEFLYDAECLADLFD
jgi:hypothetical protein